MDNREKLLDPYSLLGVAKDATERDIRLAFLRLVRKFHPDKNISEFKQDGAVEKTGSLEEGNSSGLIVKYHALYEAYSILKDPERRREYDLSSFNESLKDGGNVAWHKSVKLEDLEYMDDDGIFCSFCRCGGLILIEKRHMEEGFNIFSCDDCSSKVIITF
ncbi:DnaJ domain-containing protein [Cryptosporidium canis]|uniref:DnaJ domain-containing protein n=1 Tax=Cryptosporidium canis TaxID=195482 RepID=A0ABQ8P5R5_9CRYT|nr:DnaJ domain-containing protein [Cryptosporidium canis]